MHNSVEEAFLRAWNEKTINGNHLQDNHSDSDSGAEEKKNLEKKKKRKSRASRKANKREKKTPSQFVIKKKPRMQTVTKETHPEIMCVDEHFKSTNNQAVIIAEAKYFEGRNTQAGKNFWIEPRFWPYVKQTMLIKPPGTFNVSKINHRERKRFNLQRVTRKYEEKYLLEPDPRQGDRLCIQGQDCEGLKIGNKEFAFILKEFLLPDQEQSDKKPAERCLCLLCKRAHIGRALLNMRADGLGLQGDTILQDYFNIVNIPGEYKLQDCICSLPGCYEGLLEPVVQHIRTNYRIQIGKNGRKFIEQWKLGVPLNSLSDFRQGVREERTKM